MTIDLSTLQQGRALAERATPIDDQLRILRQAGLAVAEPASSCWPKRYASLAKRGKLPSPLWAHCAPMTHLVRGCLGGDMMIGYVNKIRHFWNRLPDGREVDLTSCQFDGDGWTPLVSGKLVPWYEYQTVPFEFLWFASRVQKWIEGNADSED